MKKFITNNWKKILMFIGAIFIVINVFTKITIDKTLLSDYIKYGKDIEKPNILENVTQVTNGIETPFGPDFAKLIVVAVVLILLVIIITSLGDKAGTKAKKK